jgi:hypothetical protein
MKIKKFLTEAKMGPKTPGHERLVSSIINILRNSYNKRVVPAAVTAYLKKLDKDEAFKARVTRKAREVGNQGYIWGSVRSRAVQHFLKH